MPNSPSITSKTMDAGAERAWSSTPRPSAVPAPHGLVLPFPPFDRRLSIVVPVHDEADNIAALIAEIHAALAGVADFEVIYVDDGSTDATPERLAAAALRYPGLRVVRHAAACGQSAAIRSGVFAARHAWIATLDGDGQNDPADIVRLFEALAAARAGSGLAMAAGWRTARHDSWLRRVSSRVANGVRARLLGDATPDTGCGLKLFARDVYLRVPFFDHQHRFLPALFMREGAGVVSVPVGHRARREGRSKYGLHDRLWVGIVDLAGVLWLLRRAARPRSNEAT